MPSNPHIEMEIRILLQKKFSPRQVLEHLLPRLFDSHLGHEDRRAIFSFAWNSGLLLPALEQVPELLRLQKPIPWSWVLELYSRSGLSPSPEVVEALIQGARIQGLKADLVLSNACDELAPEFKNLRQEVMDERAEQHRHQKQTLMEKLAFFRNERMVEEERRLLDTLKKLYPQDSSLKGLELDFRERWARHVIARHVSTEEAPLKSPGSLSKDAALEPAFREWLNLSKRRPECIYDFSVALLMMNLDLWALEILETGSELDFACDWLKAELLLRSQRHIECLEHLNSLGLRYADDPETSFAVTYMRAQCLHALGQSAQAIELLQTLAGVRPSYRSATSLLKDWGAL